jgi:hypothetical protein
MSAHSVSRDPRPAVLSWLVFNEHGSLIARFRYEEDALAFAVAMDSPA